MKFVLFLIIIYNDFFLNIFDFFEGFILKFIDRLRFELFDDLSNFVWFLRGGDWKIWLNIDKIHRGLMILLFILGRYIDFMILIFWNVIILYFKCLNIFLLLSFSRLAFDCYHFGIAVQFEFPFSQSVATSHFHFGDEFKAIIFCICIKIRCSTYIWKLFFLIYFLSTIRFIIILFSFLNILAFLW